MRSRLDWPARLAPAHSPCSAAPRRAGTGIAPPAAAAARTASGWPAAQRWGGQRIGAGSRHSSAHRACMQCATNFTRRLMSQKGGLLGQGAGSPPAPAAGGHAGGPPGSAPAPRNPSGWCGCPAGCRSQGPPGRRGQQEHTHTGRPGRQAAGRPQGFSHAKMKESVATARIARARARTPAGQLALTRWKVVASTAGTSCAAPWALAGGWRSGEEVATMRKRPCTTAHGWVLGRGAGAAGQPGACGGREKQVRSSQAYSR